MTSEEVRARLEAASNGNRAAWARANGLSAQYVNDVLVGRRAPGKGILDALNLRRVVTYETTQHREVSINS